MKPHDVRDLLARADENRDRCYLCRFIADGNSGFTDELRPLTIGGVEIKPESPLFHRRACAQRAAARRAGQP